MTLEITTDEALVLFELLHAYSARDDDRSLPIDHVAERNALWALHGALEKQLVGPFREDYVAQLAEARERVELRGGPW